MSTCESWLQRRLLVMGCFYGSSQGASQSEMLVQGILPNLAKVAPAAGISWFVFEETKRAMGMDPHS